MRPSTSFFKDSCKRFSKNPIAMISAFIMYLGHVVELADSDKLFEEPMHPYTVSLLSAIPVPDPKSARKNERVVLKGDIPSPLNAPSGCPFRTRCPFAKDACATEKGKPVLREVRKGHFVACLKSF